MLKINEFITFFGPLFNEFCDALGRKLPTQRLDDYVKAAYGYKPQIIKNALTSLRNASGGRFPSPDELAQKLREEQQYQENLGRPKTITDLFGNKVRTETPLAKELRYILGLLIGHPVHKGGEIRFTGCITGQEAIEMMEEIEYKYWIARGSDQRYQRLSIQECINRAEVDINIIKRAKKKKEPARSEIERLELKKLSNQLIPNGYWLSYISKEDKLIIADIADDIWVESLEAIQNILEF